MDLFGRQAKRELVTVTAQRNLALDAWKASTDLIEAARVIVAQKDSKIQALELVIEQLQRELDEAMPRTRPAPPISSAPLYLNEQEEDIEYAFKNNLIDLATYEDMLAQLRFDNTEITFDYS